MIWLTHAHPGYSVILLPWEFQFASVGALWMALGIAVFTVIAPCFLFLTGYRLGERVPYSPIRHLEYTLLLMLLPVGTLILSSFGSMNFGLSLTLLLYMPAIFMIEAMIAFFFFPWRMGSHFNRASCLFFLLRGHRLDIAHPRPPAVQETEYRRSGNQVNHIRNPALSGSGNTEDGFPPANGFCQWFLATSGCHPNEARSFSHSSR